MRIKFSSQEGLEYFNNCYQENQNPENNNDSQILENIDSNKTLMQTLRNFIKLKVSKTNAMKVSESILLQSKNINIPSQMPPLSPKKKKTNKTRLDLNLNLDKC